MRARALSLQRSFQVPGLAFFHDFVVTKNYYIFNAPPIKFNPLPFALGRRAPAQCIEFASGPPNMLYIVPRDRSPIMKVPFAHRFVTFVGRKVKGHFRPFKPVRRCSFPIMKVPVDPHFNFHFANGYDDEATGELVLDVVWANRMELGKTALPKVSTP